MEYAQRQLINERTRETAESHRERWTQDEIDFLEKNWSIDWETLETLAVCLNRTVEACRQKHYDLGVAREAAAVKTKKTVREVKSYTSIDQMGY